MDLKHIEELAKDNNIMQAYIVSCFMCYKDYEGDNKSWNELTEEEKETLLCDAEYYYLKDCSGASIGRICDLVIEHQKEIFEGNMSKSEFFDLLVDFECDY